MFFGEDTARRATPLSFACLLLPLWAVAAEGQPGEKSRTEPERLALRCGVLIDGLGGVPRRDALVLVEAGRISGVVQGKLPEGYRELDLSSDTVLPGLIDAHTHLLIRPGEPVPEQALRESSSLRALFGLSHAQALLESGFTSIRDVGTEGAGYADVAIREVIERGLFQGPSILAATRGITMTGGADDRHGYSPDIELPGLSMTVDGKNEMRKAVREQIKFGADVIKVYATGGLGDLGDVSGPGLSFEEMSVAVEEAARQGRRVAAHADGGPGARDAVRAGVASIEHGDHLDEATLALMAEKGVFWVPTPLILDEIIGGDQGWSPAVVEKARRTRRAFSETFGRARRLGVKIAYGTEAGGYFLHRSVKQLEIFTHEGMPPMQALLSATAVAAALLGIEARVGTIEPGKQADMIAVRGDPLANVGALQQVQLVMKNGIVAVDRRAMDHPK